MIKFIVVEDNPIHQKEIKNQILRYMMKNNFDFNIETFKDNCKELEKLIKAKSTNYIYILDFELPTSNAIEISRRIRENDWSSPIIIHTVYNSLAFDTFKQRLQILDFICKQFESEKNLEELFDICLDQLHSNKTLNFNYKNTDYMIDVSNISYIYRDTFERKSVIVTNNKEYKVSLTLSALLSKLNSNFKMSHKACIVNMKKIETINWKENKITFIDGKTTYLVSKTHKKDLKEVEIC